jgi:hypothetical protein
MMGSAQFTPEYITGQQAIDHIVETTGCTTPDAWTAFRDAAADGEGRLRVRQLDTNWVPHDLPVGYWKRAKARDDLYLMTDLHRFEVRRVDVERLWPGFRNRRVGDPDIFGPPTPGIRTNRQHAAEEACRKWLRELTEPPASKVVALNMVKDAVAHIGLLTGKAFERAWHDEARDEWKRPGRKPRQQIKPR